MGEAWVPVNHRLLFDRILARASTTPESAIVYGGESSASVHRISVISSHLERYNLLAQHVRTGDGYEGHQQYCRFAKKRT